VLDFDQIFNTQHPNYLTVVTVH